MANNDHIKANQKVWAKEAPDYARRQRAYWAGEPHWGLWHIPETDVGALPDVNGRDVVEIGCGTGYVSAWLAKRGARPIGIDPTPEQLATAAGNQKEFGIHFPLIQAAGEQLPLADESFDLAISEYGAAIWADPYRWIPEAARVLRPGGELIFLGNSVLVMLCAPEDENEPVRKELLNDFFGMHRWEWPEDGSVEFHLGHGDWIRLFRANGFEVEDLLELQPPEGATTTYEWADIEWARRWPMEEIWKVRKKQGVA
jgi:SAM-dependent methyltransferase